MYKTKGKPSGFNYFMIEFINEKSLHESNVSFIAARSLANAAWNSLSKNMRESYRIKSEEIGYQEVENKLSKIHQKFMLYDEAERKRKNYAEEQCFEFLRSSFDVPDWNSTVFILAHVNYHAKVKKNFFPCEVGLAKYSLDEGVIGTLHFLLNDGNLPIGHENEARIHSENTHQLPVNENFGINYEEANQMLTKFLVFQKEQFLFTLNELPYDVDAVEYTIKKIAGHEVFVIPLEKLLYKYKLNSKKNISPNMGREKLLNDNPWEAYDIGCKYHYQMATSKFCSLAKVKRWAYHISKLVLPRELLYPGKHTIEVFE